MTQATKKLLVLYLVTFVVAACSILYELLLANTISIIAGSTVVWYSVTMGLYLGAMGVGAFCKDRVFRGSTSGQKLFKIEIALSVLGGLVAIAINFSYSLSVYLVSLHWGQFAIGFFFAAGMILVFAVGFLSGIELPLLMEIGNDLNRSGKRISNRVLGVDYFGSLAGALLFPLLLIPNLNGFQIGFIVAGANLCMALVVLLSFIKEKTQLFLQKTLVTTLLILLLLGFFRSWQLEQIFAKKYYYYLDAGRSLEMLFSTMGDYPDVERSRSPYQLIDIVEPIEFSSSDVLVGAYAEEVDDPVEERMIFLNGDWQLATYTEKIYHEYFVHVPMLVSESVPQKVLVLGAGDGMLVRELLKYEEIEKIVHVELDQEMIELAKEHPIINGANEDSLSDERVQVVIDDAFHYVQNTSEEFGAVFIDFPEPADYNTSKIYSREFYGFAGDLLAQGGFLAMDAPGAASFADFNQEGELEMNEEESPWFQYYHTLKSAGFQTVVPFLSRLEQNNSSAKKLADYLIEEREKSFGISGDVEGVDEEEVKQEREKKIERMMQANILGSMEGFVVARKEKLHSLGVHDHGIQTMINPQRLQLAFDAPFTKGKEIKVEYVNSILKPTLPHLSVWRIRFPYKVN